jgi:hypothetical protein
MKSARRSNQYSNPQFTFIICVILFFPHISQARQTSSYVFDATALLKYHNIDRGDLALFLFSMEGIVNRTGPRLFVSCKEGFWAHGWPKAEEKWIEYCTEKKGMRFARLISLDELLDTFKQDIKGLVIYDERSDRNSTRLVAVTLAGLENLLPVSARLANLPSIRAFPVKYDFHHRWENGDYLEPYRWALKELMPRCNKSIACNVPVPFYCNWIDYPVMKKAFCCCLNFHEVFEKEGRIYRREKTDYRMTKTWEISRENLRVMLDKTPVDLYATRNELGIGRQLFKQLKPPAFIFGLGNPSETQYVEEMSAYGHSYICSQFANLSFFSQIPVANNSFKQNFHPAPSRKLKKKFYCALITSDGDSPKISQTFFAGHWFDPARGSVPITWGINPIFTEWFPVFFEYYYATATAQDYFMCACNGAGAPHIDRLPNLPQFAQLSARLCKKADLHIIDLQTGYPESVAPYAKNAPGIQGFTNCLPYFLDSCVRFINGNQPWATYSPLWYWKKNSPEELKADIENALYGKKPPFFLLIYPDFPAGNVGADWKNPDLPRRIPTLWKNTVDMLDTSVYEAVTVDALFDLIKQAALIKTSAQPHIP